MVAKAPVTYPAPKYPPTPVFGSCEADDCSSGARTECPSCNGHYCLRHAAHEQPGTTQEHAPPV